MLTSKLETQNSKPKILVVKLADLGDVLTATPALRALRKRHPDAEIDLLLTHHTQTAMRYSTLVDNLIPSDNFRFFSLGAVLKPRLLKEGLATLRNINRRGYDIVVILHHLTTRAGATKYAAIARASKAKVVAGLAPPGNRAKFLTHTIPDDGFGRRHEIDYWLDVVSLLGAKTEDREMELATLEADEAWAASMTADPFDKLRAGRRPPTAESQNRRIVESSNRRIVESSNRRIVVIHPGSGGFSIARRWAAANFAAVADALSEAGMRVVLVGTENDGAEGVKAAMNAEALDLTGQTGLHQLAALLRRADLFIGGDSGVSHIAAASGAPTVTIFGPTNAAAWGPVGPQRVVLQAKIPCGPCAYVEHQVGLREGCPAKTCLKLITSEDVVAAAVGLLREEGLALVKKLEGISRISPPSNSPRWGESLFASPPAGGIEGGRNPVIPTAAILGVRVHAVTYDQTIQKLDDFIIEGGPHQITTVNPEFVIAAQKDAVFRRVINRAALAFPDGSGMLKAAKWLKQPPLPGRIPGVDMTEGLMALAAQKGYRVYFLGAAPGVAEAAATVLTERYSGLLIAGTFAGSPRAEDEEEIVAKIQAAQPDILLVAYGAPKQDKWIARNMLRLPASVLIGVGGTFDFISGKMKRAPRWMQRLNIEWLYRLIQQPSRWRRIWNAVPRFMWLVLWERWGAGERQSQLSKYEPLQ